MSFEGLAVLITGGGGFVGEKLAARISQENPCKIVLCDVSFGQEQPLKTGIVERRIIDLSAKDVSPLEFLLAEDGGIDVVFHVASYGMSGGAQLDRPRVWSVNVGGTAQLIQAARKSGVSALVYVSTYNVVFNGYEIYEGNEDTLPYVSPDDHVDMYSKTKCLAEQLVLSADGTTTGESYLSDPYGLCVLSSSFHGGADSSADSSKEFGNAEVTEEDETEDNSRESGNTEVTEKDETEDTSKESGNAEVTEEDETEVDCMDYCMFCRRYLDADSTDGIDSSGVAIKQMLTSRRLTHFPCYQEYIAFCHRRMSRPGRVLDALIRTGNDTPSNREQLRKTALLHTCAVRPAAIYGEGEQRHLPRIVNLVNSGLGFFAIGSSDILCDWVHVDNLVHCLLLAGQALLKQHQEEKKELEAPEEPREYDRCAGGEAFFCSDGVPVNNFDFIADMLTPSTPSSSGSGSSDDSIESPLLFWLRVPPWLMYAAAACIESCHHLLSLAGCRFEPFLTKAEVCKVRLIVSFEAYMSFLSFFLSFLR
jgi:nucleoside-diphosphate-sugar epimerase